MSIPYAIAFALMLIPSMIAMAIASKHWAALIWNYTWFLILARVGLEAFGSVWGAFPALVFALNYAFRAMRPRAAIPAFNMHFWGARPSHSEPAKQPSARVGDVIDAEFHREND